MTGRLLRPVPQPWRRPLLFAAAIVAGWTLMALLWTPPSILVARSEHRTIGAAHVFLQVFLSFLPWMLATPALLWLSARFPIAERGMVRSAAIHIGIGVVLIPAMALCGLLLNAIVQHPAGLTTAVALGGSMITALYSVPTYIAVVGIGQAMAYLERYRARERLLARAQLQALQAQIHPHFLFNALNAISALGYSDPARADAALTELAALLRLALIDGPSQIPLKEEVAFLQNCVDVYALLIAGGLQFEIDIAPEAWEAHVPRMILQPLVENAILHGLARRKDGGRLALGAQIDAARLVLTLTNDAAEISKPAGGSGLGLANVRDRLQVLYGDAAGVTLTPLEDGRMQAQVVLPLRHGEGSA